MPGVRVAFDVGPVRNQPAGVGIFASSMAEALSAALGAGELVLIGKRRDVGGLPDRPSRPLTRGGYLGWLQTRASLDVRRARADVGHFSDGMVPIVRGARTVVTIHDLSVVRSWRTHPTRRLLRIPFVLTAPRMADLVIVPSRATADEVMRLTRTRSDKIEVVPNAPRDRITSTDDRAIDATLRGHGLDRYGYILALGTIEPRKNLVRLVDAFERLVSAEAIPPDLKLVIAGHVGWRAARILQRIDTSPAAARILRLGYVPAPDLNALLAGAAAVAYPSLYEGFGLPVVEAMAHGAPTVTSNLSSMPEVAGDAAFLVDPYDPEDIARGLEIALRAGDSDRPGVAARSIAQASRFSWKRSASATVELYRSRLA